MPGGQRFTSKINDGVLIGVDRMTNSAPVTNADNSDKDYLAGRSERA
jgi:hypothetical protein